MKFKDLTQYQYVALCLLVFLGLPSFCIASESDLFQITLENHQFSPAELTVPANKRFKLEIENKDATPEEFESHDFKREKMVPGNGKVAMWVGPLKPGTYKYFGEFNSKTAKGILKAE